MRERASRQALVCAVVAAAWLVTVLPAVAVNPASGPTSTGQTLNVSIDSPTNGATVPAGSLTVTGRASVGALSANANVVYIVDTSGSTSSPTGQDCNGDGAANAGDDFNGNGTNGETIDCEISGIIALNGSLVGATVDVGVVQFSSDATALDVNPAAAGTQTFTTPGADANANGSRDIDEVVRAFDAAGGTEFDAALTAMNASFATQPAGERNVGFFLSDGVASVETAAGSPVQAAKSAGTVVNTYSIGTGAAGCATGSSLRVIADTTGGTCTEVTDPSKLVAAITGGGGASGITRVDVRVDGGTPITATLDALGNWTATVSLSGTGTRTISATAVATDNTAVTADIQVTLGGAGPTSTSSSSTSSTTSSTTSTSTTTISTTTSTTTTQPPAIVISQPTPTGGLLAKTGAALRPLIFMALLALVLGTILRFERRGGLLGEGPGLTVTHPPAEWGPAQIGRAIGGAVSAVFLGLLDRFRRR